MKVYLDMCCIQRPLDTKLQLRIVLEADAILGVISLCEAGVVDLIVSDAHTFETSRNPHPTRKQHAIEVTAKATEYVSATEAVKNRAAALNAKGIKPLDALHLASAIEVGAAYFCTCDDRFYKKAKHIDTGETAVVTPLELIAELEK